MVVLWVATQCGTSRPQERSPETFVSTKTSTRSRGPEDQPHFLLLSVITHKSRVSRDLFPCDAADLLMPDTDLINDFVKVVIRTKELKSGYTRRLLRQDPPSSP